ncbi:MAG: hypothetical protein B7Z15_05520 [Rhizobiales bacterium 32-66-8]|nr:MAG: hypothetical protein B7Z15_05520 [Rhizobiales bacterium 32-66-8]
MWLDSLAPLSPGASGDDALPPAAFRSLALRAVRIAGADVPVREDVAATLPFAVLRRFTRGDGPRRVLVVAPLAGGFPALMRDLVVALLGIADTVALTDWADARHVPLARGAFGLADNCLQTAQMIRALGPDVHVVSVCQGVIPALAASALLAEEGLAPRSLSLIGGPVDTACRPTRLDRLLTSKPLADLAAETMEPVLPPFAGAGRQVFPHRRQMQAFGLYLWRQSLFGGELPRKLMLDDGSDPFRFPLARLCWDMMDIPAEFFLENVARVFQERALPNGTLTVAGHAVRPDRLTDCALLTVEGEDDDISAPGQTEAAHALCPNIPPALHQSVLVPRAGHFSLFYGTRMRRHVLPALEDIFRRAEALPRQETPEATA